MKDQRLNIKDQRPCHSGEHSDSGITHIGFWVRSLCSLTRMTTIIIALFSTLTFASSVYAQTIDPSTWQNNANGLLTTSNSLNKTAGLVIQAKIPDTRSWPNIILQGGLITSYGRLTSYDFSGNPIGIDLGQVKVPSAASVTSTQTADWVHNVINFNSSQLNITLTRLTPAILTQSSANALRFFSGNVTGSTFDGTNFNNREANPSYPRYVAFHTPSGYQVRALSTVSTALAGIDQNWILVWYGNNSHFTDTKYPTSYSLRADWAFATIPNNQAYQADSPMLFTFQNNPTSIIHSPEGGIDLSFSSEAGNISLMPLFGRDHPQASVTEGWGSSRTLPSSGTYNVISKLNFWVPRTCNFPGRVAESYSYDPSTDTASITDNITFTNICPATPTFAPIPPMLAIAKNTLGITFSGTVVDSNTHTEFGPLQGIENTSTYTWNLSGLKKYTDNKRVVTGTGTAPNDLIQELQSEVDKITQAGHLAPWIFDDKRPNNMSQGEVYWLNPAETLYHLAEVIPVIPEPHKTNLINYLQSERTNPDYNPETVYNLTLGQGKTRGDYTLTSQEALSVINNSRHDIFLDHVPLYSFSGLAKYYEVSGTPVTQTVINSATAALNTDFSETDWATFSKFQTPKLSYIWPGMAERKRKEDVIEENRLFAGMVGMIRLAQQAGDKESENIARALIARVAVTRLAMLQYPRYLYSAGMIKLPALPSWQVVDLAATTPVSHGFIVNYNWTQSMDDQRQVAVLDQFEARLRDHIDDAYQVSPYYTAYRDMIPELFRFLVDYAKEELDIYRSKIMATDNAWYGSFREAILGNEHGLNHPIDAYQLFMAQALVAKDTPQNLSKYLDIPWVATGDLFYITKLAETIKAYQGWVWEDELSGPSLRGDVNQDTQVNVLDVQACVNHILGIQDLGNRADVNGDGNTDVLDVQAIVNIILGV